MGTLSSALSTLCVLLGDLVGLAFPLRPLLGESYLIDESGGRIWDFHSSAFLGSELFVGWTFFVPSSEIRRSPMCPNTMWRARKFTPSPAPHQHAGSHTLWCQCCDSEKWVISLCSNSCSSQWAASSVQNGAKCQEYESPRVSGKMGESFETSSHVIPTRIIPWPLLYLSSAWVSLVSCWGGVTLCSLRDSTR